MTTRKVRRTSIEMAEEGFCRGKDNQAVCGYALQQGQPALNSPTGNGMGFVDNPDPPGPDHRTHVDILLDLTDLLDVAIVPVYLLNLEIIGKLPGDYPSQGCFARTGWPLDEQRVPIPSLTVRQGFDLLFDLLLADKIVKCFRSVCFV